MTLGFTGTEHGMTPAQLETVRQLFRSLPLTHLHHGDCVGADAEAHRLALEVGAWITIHPPLQRKLRAFCQPHYAPSPIVVKPELPYLVRNTNIANEGCHGLIATPPGFTEVMRGNGGGTWSTVRRARKRKRPIWVVLPDGTIQHENGARVREDFTHQLKISY
jgi:hypothetical protein